MTTYMEYYEEWLQNKYFDDEFKKELLSIGGNQKEIKDRFYKDLEFGTAGMRGIMGAGRNRMNRYVVRKATQAYANFLIKRNRTEFGGKRDKIVVISYDSRHNSSNFASETAAVLAGNGFLVYIYDNVRTTPQLSYSVRHLNAIGGVMLTASHNPPEYNGYKVYDENGCQLVPEMTDILIEEFKSITNFDMIYYLPMIHAMETDIIKYVPSIVDENYIQMVKGISLRPKVLENSPLRTVYTPLHGASGNTIINLMRKIGKKRFITVDSQIEPDPNFPTIKTPNPETPEAFEEAGKYMRQNRGDIAIATDPDGDRLGVMTKKGVLLTGNQLGVLFIYYILSTLKEQDRLKEGDYIISTVVSSDLAIKIAKSFGVGHMPSLTGFKHMGEIVQRDPEHFIFAYEESYGYLFSPEVRDKDANMASLMAIEMATHYNNNLEYILRKIYKEYGYYLDHTDAKIYLPSEFSKVAGIMDSFRKASKEQIGYHERIDYLNDETGLRKSNFLKFYIDEDSWVVIRPSGTEPKLKTYYNICAEDKLSANQKLEVWKNKFDDLIKEFTK